MDEINNQPWGEPKQIITRNGPKMVKSAVPNEQWWSLWREHKEALKSAGFSLGKWNGSWQLSWWEPFRLPVIDKIEVEKIELPELDPLVNQKSLYEWQVPLTSTVVRAMKHYGVSLNGCGTGLGKTIMTLAAIRERGAKCLVVCPKPIVFDWIEAAAFMGVECVGAFGWEWIKTGKTPFLKWNYKRTKKKSGDSWVLVDQKDTMEWTIPSGVEVVIDEAHRAANDGTQNSKMVMALAGTAPAYLLSATIADNPTKLRATGYLLGLHDGHKGYYDWMGKHGVVHTRFGPQFQGGARHLKAIHQAIFPHKGIRVRAEQLGDKFPATQILAKAYNMDEAKEIRGVYSEMSDRIAELQEKENSAASILAEITRARQRVELLKVPLMVSLSQDMMEEGNSMFLAVNFRDTLKELVKQLGVKSIILGGQRPNDRKAMIDAFQANETNVIAGIIKACREGLNLHDTQGGHPRVALIMPTPSAFDLRQVLGRVWRAGGKTPSLQRILFAAKTIEEDVCKSLATKLDQLDTIMDGDLQQGVFPASYSTMRPQTEQEEELL